MSLQDVLAVSSSLTGSILAIVVLYLVVVRRNDRMAKSFMLVLISTIIWSVGYLTEMISPNHNIKVIAAETEYIGIAILPVAWLIFSSRYARRFEKIMATRNLYLLFIIPIITISLVFTNAFHHLIWSEIRFYSFGNVEIVLPEYGPWFWIHAIYSYMVFMSGSFVLLIESARFSRIHRERIFMLMIASLLPLFTNITYVFRLYPFDLTPLSFALSMTLLFFCVYRLKLVDIVPVARDKIIENIDDIVMVFDDDNKLVDLNLSAERILSARRKDLIGKEAKDIFLMCPEISDLICKGESKKTYEKFGRFYDIKLTPLRDKEGKEIGKILIARDITDLKRYQDELEKLNKNLEKEVEKRTKQIQKLLDQKNDFIKQLGHDLKTPLTPILSLLPLIRDRVEDADTKRLLDVVIRNAHYMKNLVTDTLKLAKLNSPDVEFNIEQFKLSDIVEESIRDNEHAIKEKGINPVNKIDETIFVKADKLRLKEVFANLISNSVKYTPEGGKIEFLARREGNNVIVEVRDNGIGLEDSQKSKIFDEFYKVDKSRHNIDSSGLGLTICKRIIEKHGGKIWAESEGLGKGTSICFTLPASKRGE